MKLPFIFLTILLVVGACSENKKGNPPLQGSNGSGNPPQQDAKATLGNQIGSTWDRFAVTEDFLNQQNNQALNIAARATARFESFSGHGTVFYLGKFNGRHIAATNKHVVTPEFSLNGMDPKACVFPGLYNSGAVTFNSLFYNQKPDIHCKKILESWPSIDFALIEIEDSISPSYLDSVEPLRLARDIPPQKGQELITIGYGTQFNDSPNLQKATLADSCKVFSDEIYYLADNADRVEAWSIATGCDASTGDSGSAVVDKTVPGLVYGVLWSAAASENSQITNDQYLEGLFYGDSSDTVFWHSLTYAVPSSKIIEILEDWIKTQDAHLDDVQTIQLILNAQ